MAAAAVPSPTGILLFLFIPAVLVLYLLAPLGLAASVPLGIALMLGHRFLARPWFERNLPRRCFWCSRPVGGGSAVEPFRSRGKTVAARVCSGRCGERLVAFGRAVAVARVALVVLILVPVGVYLANALALIAGMRAIPLDAARWLFKAPVATAVVGISLAYPLGRRSAREPAVDFPVHNLFLLGTGTTLWVFRIVGGWWLIDGLRRLIAGTG